MKLDTPLIKVIRASRRLNIALSGVLPLLLVMCGVLYWDGQRILQQEEEKLRIDFSVLMGFIQAHETVLQGLHAQGLNPDGHRLVEGTPVSETSGFERASWEFFDGQHAVAAMPFSLLCQSSDSCPVVNGVFTGIGGYMSDFYSTRWAASVYPAAPLFIISPSQQLSLSVPAISAVSGYEPLTRAAFLSVVNAVQLAAGGADPDDQSVGTSARITWLRDPGLPNAMVAMMPMMLPLNAKDSTATLRRNLYAATLLTRSRVSIAEQVLKVPLYDQFWLQRQGGELMIGDGPPPDSRPGFHFTTQGMMLRIEDRTGTWTAYYRLNYGSYFRANMWLPIAVLVMFGVGLAAGVGYLFWYNRRVIRPAELAHLDMVESEEFSRTVLDTAPVALCVLSRPEGRIVFGNARASQWLGIGVGEQLQDSPDVDTLLRKVLGATGPGTIETFHTHEGRPLFVAFAPTRYKKQDVVLCAFADISARAEMERTLAQAKQQADRANEAKSTFLATMSHEIRTPLYGVLGTLEVLSLTRLDGEQRRHVDRIQDSSVILQQLISDILDITKIESGQLALEMDQFDPRELVQGTVASYAGMAEQKGLVIYSCVDTSVPACVMGDGGRVRQILSNLVNNAIKFTDSGHVVTRLRAEDLPDGRTRLHLQVVDSGVGISAENQVRLFEPFYQIDSGSHLVRGAGIGLSICARLAELMGSEIQVTSELGLGSSFSLAVELAVAEAPPAPAPRLDGLRVQVRSSRKELSENICLWLTQWGAKAVLATAVPLREDAGDEVLVDVHIAGDVMPPWDWPGPVVVAGGNTPGVTPYRADRHDVFSIGFAVQRCAAGEAEIVRETVAARYAPLNLRVLVAEDNPINQVTMRDQLEQLGCNVTVAPDGAEALAQWHIAPFDVVLTDVNMPRMNGYELAGALRALGLTVPIIGVTANALKDEETRCKAAGMSHWLVKPIKLSLLWNHLRPYRSAAQGVSAVARALGAAPAAAEVPVAPPSDATAPEAPAPDVPAPDLPAPDVPAPDVPTIPAKYREIFRQTMSHDLARLERAIAERDARELRLVLHRMRGGFAAVQARDLHQLAQSAEDTLAADGLGEAVSATLKRLVAALAKTLADV